MADGAVPGNAGCDELDAHCGPQWTLRNERRHVDVALSNSFGFGGNNICLAFAQAERTQ
jgi:3-oxoacyl-(acyl-carrier-protein) synthase